MNGITTSQIAELINQSIKGCITRELLQSFLENPSGFTKEKTFYSSAIAAKYGFTVVSDVEPSQFKVKNLKFITFLKDDEPYVNGNTMCQRAITLNGNLGLADGQYLLDHQKEIPKKMRGKYIVLPGTLLRLSGGGLGVAYLHWSGDQWVLNFRWIDDDFYGDSRFVRCE